ncbi:MAG TPA: hypothetical protein VM141_08490 [Planctomycetota bacterium]|nr:hypothetical protein [Planctomycetota bacterium]
MVIYLDKDIEELLHERKQFASAFPNSLQLRQKRGHKEQEFSVKGEAGNQFLLIVRQNDLDPLDFSVILAACPANSNRLFRLRRYNGMSHEHTNIIEANRFGGCHIHRATQRYQELGIAEDSYAEPTDTFVDLQSAWRCLLADCGFELPQNPQIDLFPHEEQT